MEIEKLNELMIALKRAEAQLGDKIRRCNNHDRMLDLVNGRLYANRILDLYRQNINLDDNNLRLAETIISLANQKERVEIR